LILIENVKLEGPSVSVISLGFHSPSSDVCEFKGRATNQNHASISSITKVQPIHAMTPLDGLFQGMAPPALQFLWN
jgi:hypothetical protein